MVSWTKGLGWVIETSERMVDFISSALVRPEVKTAIGVHLIKEPLLYEFMFFLEADSTQIFYVGSSYLSNGLKA